MLGKRIEKREVKIVKSVKENCRDRLETVLFYLHERENSTDRERL